MADDIIRPLRGVWTGDADQETLLQLGQVGVRYGGVGLNVVKYLLQDEFTTPLTAGSVDGTDAEPGAGTRHTTAGNVSIASGALVIAATGSWGEASYRSGSFSRVAGRMLVQRVQVDTPTTAAAMVGPRTDTNISGNTAFGGHNLAGLSLDFASFAARHNTSGASPAIYPLTGATYYTIVFAHRAIGKQIFIDGNLVWIDDWDSTATLYGGITGRANTTSLDYERVPEDLFLAAPLASDGFGSTFGTTDGAGHAETSGIGSGGGSKTYSQVGTWATASGKASASALSSGIAHASVECGTRDVFADVDLTRSTGEIGLLLRYKDGDNYAYLVHDGTNVKLVEVVSGTPSTLLTSAATYSADATLRVSLIGTAYRVYYNGLLVGSGTMNAALSDGTKHGLYANNTTDEADNLVIYASTGHTEIDQYAS